ncbi:MobA/MobL family protein [uncultured Roseibium sp.]|uniref:MobA/MobL family protein n=1 Tax=uncultured Roseibium sp. TaxID=1936171 RepID=UPI00261EFC93|nr:MobA/MobL family protein [uncultured Roseibium sp.]
MQDGNIHCHVDNLARRNKDGNERIAIAKAAYNAGERLWSDRQQRHVDFGNREDVVFTNILLPEGAPPWAGRRKELWNKVDVTAKRRDARLAKSIEAAITRDIPVRMRPALLEAFVKPFVALGCVADIAIHEDGTDHNPHVHILLTTRFLEEDGFGAKITALEQRAFVKRVRQNWSDLTNSFLEKSGSTLRVDHRSYKARGIGAEPTRHRGPNPTERRNKREHARRVREEKTMSGPEKDELERYPLLSQRETWPPEPEASPDMTPQERDEHHRYWQDKVHDRPEAASPSEPANESFVRRSKHFIRRASPDLEVKPWYEQALDNAYGDMDGGFDIKRLEEYERSVVEGAFIKEYSNRELAVLQAAGKISPEVRRMALDLILDQRMQVIREQDQLEKLYLLPTDIRHRIEDLRPDTWGRDDPGRPVPGPNGELISQREQDIAYEQMLEEYLREEPEQDRDR